MTTVSIFGGLCISFGVSALHFMAIIDGIECNFKLNVKLIEVWYRSVLPFVNIESTDEDLVFKSTRVVNFSNEFIQRKDEFNVENYNFMKLSLDTIDSIMGEKIER